MRSETGITSEAIYGVGKRELAEHKEQTIAAAHRLAKDLHQDDTRYFDGSHLDPSQIIILYEAVHAFGQTLTNESGEEITEDHILQMANDANVDLGR